MPRKYALRKYAVVALLAFVLTGCREPSLDTVNMPGPDGKREVPVKVTACQIMTDPAAYNHKLVEVSGTLSQGFEEFSLYAGDFDCPAKASIWLEFGGTYNSGTTYCCPGWNGLRRPETGMVDDIRIPLVEDRETMSIVRRIQSGDGLWGDTVLVARFFAGKKTTAPGGTYWGGYGHFGMSSLLVIEQVVSLKPRG